MRTIDPSAAALRGRFRRAAISLLTLGVFAACTAAAMATDQTSLATGQAYKVAGTFGKEGTGNGQWSSQVTALATDASGNVYVADGNLSRIQAFTAKGAFLRKYVITGGGGITSDVAVGPTGDVFGATQVGGLVRRFPKAGGTPEDL